MFGEGFIVKQHENGGSFGEFVIRCVAHLARGSAGIFSEEEYVIVWHSRDDSTRMARPAVREGVKHSMEFSVSLSSEHSMEYPQSSVHLCPDWRYHLRSEVRHGIINQMVAVLRRISNRIVTYRVYNFQIAGVKLEEAAYNRANCQEEYVQRICANLAHFWMQTINRQANSSN